MKSVKNKIINAKDKVAGEAKELVGKATNNEELELKGKIQSTKADLKTKVAKAKDHIVGDINDEIDKK
jgi:uncharacterized protein YjbJ (UPF0337 family)